MLAAVPKIQQFPQKGASQICHGSSDLTPVFIAVLSNQATNYSAL